MSTNFDTACGIDGISHENLGRIPAGVAGGIYGFQPEYLGKIPLWMFQNPRWVW